MEGTTGMKGPLLVFLFVSLAACTNTELGGSFSVSGDDVRVSPTISGQTGNTRTSLRLNL